MATNAAGEEGEEESALATEAVENGPTSDLRGRLEASTETGTNSNGDVVVGLEKIPRCSMQNLTVIMTRSVENAFYRLVQNLNNTG